MHCPTFSHTDCNVVRVSSFRILAVGAFLLSLSAASVYAFDLHGTVRDQQGFAITGARVALRVDGGAGAERSMASDGAGRYRFEGLQPGTYWLDADAPGFERRSEQVVLSEAGAETDIALEPAALHSGVVVTASRQETDTAELPLPTALQSDRRLQEQLSTNLAQALQEAPGVTWVNAGAFRSRPVIRGLDSNRILVLVD